MAGLNNQDIRWDAGFAPMSRLTPNRIVSTNEEGYAIATGVTLASLNNFEDIVNQVEQQPTFTDDSFDI